MKSDPRRRHPLLRATLLAGGLHLAWELLQTPFFDERSYDWWAIAWARLHCSIADVAIQALAFVITAWLWNDLRGPWRPGPGPFWTFIGVGMVYTAGGEILHVQWLGTWAYADRMPVVPSLGVGLVPLLQWLVVPAVWWRLTRGMIPASWVNRPARPRVALLALGLVVFLWLWPRVLPMYGVRFY